MCGVDTYMRDARQWEDAFGPICSDSCFEIYKPNCKHKGWRDLLMAGIETGICCEPFCGTCGIVWSQRNVKLP